ncbi:ABC transporter ATP-binding protein [Lactobacillus mulieris]|jgi:multidrug resistance ABC superfamily ATP binding cassette transporter, membrane protein|uniref:ABC transporter ATP-binding protein/permease n=2 Tax=Lactobacillus mulieris TaxID=2508708 RepID=A0AAP3GVX8_9LACO|nr:MULTISPECIES: ABC transporter ATP-binding protein [Lactobacillus]EFH30353.1 ABC transporter, ATP-binding protein [Lactobacillus jensenii JV-V16]KAA9245124.1 ABC transporter ATP-binding protein [Lactobacillus jensenii]MCZ3844495.1 ABC transporter ATP-binding protein/permease [Lactobacillus mulieris]MCZ3876483.1 ABC transporter ATP-binding protein/permease [Lactobacillus mulieris]MCZ3899595.1 ABC transporter ATP-binding protein/permease [Lactobacillus mulieris]
MEKQQQPVKKRKALKRLLMYVLKTGPAAFPLSLLGIVISAFSTVYGSLFIERLIDDYITPMLKESTPNFTPLFRAIIMLGVIYLIGVVATYAYTLLMMILAQKVQKSIRDDMFKHMQYLPISYFDQNEYGDIMSRYTNDIDTLMQMISQSIPQFVNSTLSIIFVLGSMLILSWQLTIVALVIFALAVGIVKYLTNKSGNYFKIQQKKLGELNGYNEEMLSGLKVIKVFSHEEFAKKDFEKYNEELRIASGNANVYATVLFPIMGNIGNISYVLIALIGGVSAINGYLPLTLGAIASFLQLSRSFSMPIAQISQQLNSIVMALAGADRIFNLLDQEKEIDQGQVTIAPDREVKGAWDWQVPSENAVKEVPVKGHISFKNVNFGYVPDKQILYNINLEAKPGMKVALVGETGAGKTTISSMINRFYEISSGQILYDGIDIKNIRKDDLRQSVAIVLQDTHMFTGTIMDNIRFGNPDASDDDVYQAARLAHADEFIHELDDGYNTVIDGDGGDLSQGQMQLLSIARAMIADRPVMILDEATSSIDTRTERMVQQGMDNLLAGRTSFVIAHRLSTIVNSDIICVLDHGHIIEAGNHQELLAKKGYYYELYTGKKEIE